MTLRGLDPETDGIRGPAGEIVPQAALQVWYADGVGIENLTVTGSTGIGLGAWFSNLEIRNSRFVDNASTGAHISASSYAMAEGSTFRGNRTGAFVQREGLFVCTDCEFADNRDWALVTAYGATGWLESSRLSGLHGAYGMQGAYLTLADSTVAVEQFGAAAWSAYVRLIETELEGSLWAGDHAHLELIGVTQTGNPLGNQVYADAVLATYDAHPEGADPVPTHLLGDVSVGTFASATLMDGTTLSGNMQCWGAGDAWAAEPGNIGGVVTGCAHCSKP